VKVNCYPANCILVPRCTVMKRKTTQSGLSTDKQPRISSFFAQQSPVQKKRAQSRDATVDLTIEDPEADEQPPIKKLKVEKGNSLADQWRFGITRKSSIERPIAGDEDDKKRRHEEFKRVLLAGNSSFARSRRIDEQVHSSEDESSQDRDDALGSDVSDEAFKNLKEIFSHKPNKVKGKTRLTSSAKGKRTSEGLGPSGQPFTPAELQASFADCSHVPFDHVLVQS